MNNLSQVAARLEPFAQCIGVTTGAAKHHRRSGRLNIKDAGQRIELVALQHLVVGLLSQRGRQLLARNRDALGVTGVTRC